MAKKSAPAEASLDKFELEGDEPEVVVEDASKWKRVYQSEQSFNSDLFRLRTAKMIKDQSLNKDGSELKEIDHEHFWHTYDSGGKKLDQSTPTGNHFHIMTLKTAPNGAPIATCSGPKMIKHVKGKRQIVGCPNDDQHIHTVEYERSSLVKPRTVNIESTKIISADAAKAAPVPGIRS